MIEYAPREPLRGRMALGLFEAFFEVPDRVFHSEHLDEVGGVIPEQTDQRPAVSDILHAQVAGVSPAAAYVGRRLYDGLQKPVLRIVADKERGYADCASEEYLPALTLDKRAGNVMPDRFVLLARLSRVTPADILRSAIGIPTFLSATIRRTGF